MCVCGGMYILYIVTCIAFDTQSHRYMRYYVSDTCSFKCNVCLSGPLQYLLQKPRRLCAFELQCFE